MMSAAVTSADLVKYQTHTQLEDSHGKQMFSVWRGHRCRRPAQFFSERGPHAALEIGPNKTLFLVFFKKPQKSNLMYFRFLLFLVKFEICGIT